MINVLLKKTAEMLLLPVLLNNHLSFSLLSVFSKESVLLLSLFKKNLSLISLYYAEACNEFAVPISAS